MLSLAKLMIRIELCILIDGLKCGAAAGRGLFFFSRAVQEKTY